MNIQTRILAAILIVTGYRFQKEGVFGRGSRFRTIARALGVNVIGANIIAGL